MRQVNRKKLTKSLIDGLEFEGGGPSQQICWDTEIPNLGMRFYESGRKSFVIQYSMQGRWRLMVLAQYGILTVDQARKRARKELAGVSEAIDPIDARKRLRQAKTVSELCEQYIEYQKTQIKTWDKDESRLEKYVIPHIGKRRVETIDLEDMQAIHKRVSTHAPYQANRVASTCSKMFNKAKQWKIFPPELPNPCKGIERNKEQSRAEYVTPEKLPELIKAIDAEKDPYVRGFFWLALLTGMRRGELLNLKWDDVDLDQKRVYLRDTKSGEPRYVPLSKAAIKIIKAMPKMLKNPYLLPGHVRGKPLHNLDKPWRRIRKAADVPRLRIHDLRRTAGSWMVQAGSSIHAVKDVLGHKKTLTTEIYARLADQQSRDAVEAHGEALLKAAKAGHRA